jgi:hypothetical protein
MRQGEALLEPGTKVTAGVAAEYARCTAEVWSSKGMLELIRRKMSSSAAPASPDRPSTSTSSPLGESRAPDQAAPRESLHAHHTGCSALTSGC